MAQADPKNKLTPYSIYLDESFYRFWGFENPEGNFCYAVFGLPRHCVPSLEEFHKDVLTEFRNAVRAELTEEPPPELKSHIFRRLTFKSRRKLGLALADFMKRTGAFLLADFTQVRGFVLEWPRSVLARQGHDSLPDQWQPLYEKRREVLMTLVAQGKAGQAPILRDLMGTTLSGLAFFLMSRAEKYDVFFDPRDPSEDAEVADSIREFTESALREVHLDQSGRFEGVSSEMRSEESPGLQFADLLVGEVRNWFLAHEDFLHFQSSMQLVTERTANAIHCLVTPQGFLPKKERVITLPIGLAGRLSRVDKNSILPFFRNHLARNLLSCVAFWGEFRHVNFGDGTIIDSLDDWEAARAV